MVGAAFDAFSTAQGGWDYTNLMALGATAAIARVLGLNAGQTREAMGMTVVPHFASDEIESGELNRRGDLSMWKRFNGADAVRNSLQACFLAQAGVDPAHALDETEHKSQRAERIEKRFTRPPWLPGLILCPTQRRSGRQAVRRQMRLRAKDEHEGRPRPRAARAAERAPAAQPRGRGLHEALAGRLGGAERHPGGD
jgi:hypothetical protein